MNVNRINLQALLYTAQKLYYNLVMRLTKDLMDQSRINLKAALAAAKTEAEDIARLEAMLKENKEKLAALFPSNGPAGQETVFAPVTNNVPDAALPTLKAEIIAKLAKSFIMENGPTSSKGLVAAIENSVNSEVLNHRGNKLVAVSQALGKYKDQFSPDRKVGWSLIGVNQPPGGAK
jgi:hypothetical protein